MTTSSSSDQQHQIFISVDVFGIINLAAWKRRRGKKRDRHPLHNCNYTHIHSCYATNWLEKQTLVAATSSTSKRRTWRNFKNKIFYFSVNSFGWSKKRENTSTSSSSSRSTSYVCILNVARFCYDRVGAKFKLIENKWKEKKKFQKENL